ncbi:hypothetical protein CIPAW_03G101800 [Carya illinoinensis]|uniref:Hexosyltransferase n=1 Tax=Carya illinoinensis TaxID=32201 RepID=A0A8T1R0Y4_CARIL|nr:hypothetical protein CIPAW_03G101800 [Carya illinoinensis]
MIYLDGDIQVFENIDHLSDLPDNYCYAMMDHFCEKTWRHSPHTRLVIDSSALARSSGPFKNLKTTPPTPFSEQVVM